MKGSIRAMLDRFMKTHMNDPDDQLQVLADIFKTRLQLAHDIFGAHMFCHKVDKGEWQKSYPLYDGVMVALDRLWESRKELITAKAKIGASLAKLLRNEDDFEVIIGKPNTAKAVLQRMDLITDAMRAAL